MNLQLLVIVVSIFALRALVCEGNESRLSAQCHGLQRAIWRLLEYEMSLTGPCFQLSTTAEYFTVSSLFLFTFPVPSSFFPALPLHSSFQSYSCGSEGGGDPGGEERLLHCHERRGHALQLGKL